MRGLYCLIIFLFTMFVPSFAQNGEVDGYVHEQGTSLPINKAIITISNQKSSVLYSCVTNKEGKFHLSTKGEELSLFILKVSCMGYKTASCPMGNKKSFLIELEPKAFALKDVYVKAQKITHHNDTTSYLVSGFSSAKDRTIGDVLKKMPGIEVAKNGSVSYNGKAINEFLVEGVDLFDGQYNIATRNISHDLISKVDIIENYQSAKVMKDSKSEGGTVLNLNLKDKAKGRWSGNAKIGGGVPNLWEEELFAAKLSSTNQTAITLKTNNSGKDILSENKTLTLDDLLSQEAMDEPKNIMEISQEKPGSLDDKRTRNARTHLVNISNVQKVSDTAILHSKIYYTDDRNISDKEKGVSYFLADSTLTKNTKEYSILGTKELVASVLFKNDGKKSFFSDELKYSSLWQRNQTKISGDYSNLSVIHSDVHSIDNKLKWIRPIGKHYLTVESRNKFQTLPEKLCVEADGQSLQDVKRKQFLSMTKLNYTWNMKRWAFSIDTKGILSASNIKSNFMSDNIDTTFYENSSINYLSLIVCPSLIYKIKGIRSEIQAPLSVYHYWGLSSSDRVFYLPEWTFSWQVSSRWKLRTNLSLGSTAPSVNNSYVAPIMTDSKTFSSSPIINYWENKQNSAFSISYTDYTHMLFGNASVGFNWGKDKSNTTKWVERDLVFYSKEKGNNTSRGTMILGSLSKRIEGIRGMVNAKCLGFLNRATILQNGESVDYKTNMWQTSVGLNSNVHDWLEIDYQLGYNINSLSFSKAKTSTKLLTQALNISFLPIEDLTLTVMAEHYANYFSSLPSKQTIFSDIRCVYKYHKVDFVGCLTNVFNQKYYNNTSYTDLSSSYRKFSLRGRTFLLSVVTYF